MQNKFFILPLLSNSYYYTVSYFLFFFLNVIFITIITTYINDKCCKDNVGAIVVLLTVTSLFITAIISRFVCIYDKKTINSINKHDEYIYYEEDEEYAEV
tara:strand:+ start:3184 stop:3483 length:300 start_codon:yes stop_codon:yes gene_type:complete